MIKRLSDGETPFQCGVREPTVSMRCKPGDRGSLPGLAHFEGLFKVSRFPLEPTWKIWTHIYLTDSQEISLCHWLLYLFYDKRSSAPLLGKPTQLQCMQGKIPANVNKPTDPTLQSSHLFSFTFPPTLTSFSSSSLLCVGSISKRRCMYILYCSQAARASASWLQLGEQTTGRHTHHQEFKGQLTGRKEKKRQLDRQQVQ